MTVDKPPLALWVQALSVRVFGYHPLSILVPQALMGMASVGARLRPRARGASGASAGSIAGLALALTPIAVAVSRHNNPDALLVLCCVAALWCAVRALEAGAARRAGWCSRASAWASASRRRWGSALVVVPGDRRGLDVGRARRPRTAARAAPAAGGRRRDGRSSAAPGPRSSN